MDERYPPRNRLPETLDYMRTELRHADGVLVLDPNGLMKAAMAEPWTILDLVPLPGAVSDISGAPAIRYRSRDYELSLTPGEVVRMLSRNLDPDEFFELRDRYGIFYEIHDDFFDCDSGRSVGRLDVPGGVPNREQPTAR